MTDCLICTVLKHVEYSIAAMLFVYNFVSSFHLPFISFFTVSRLSQLLYSAYIVIGVHIKLFVLNKEADLTKISWFELPL